MKKWKTARLAPLLLLAVTGGLAGAQEAPPAGDAEAAEAARAAEAQAVAAYEQTLKASEAEQRAALDAVEAARSRLQAQAAAAQAQDEAHAADQNRREKLNVRQQEMLQVQRELERAHESLRRATRDVARVHRQINRPHPAPHTSYSVVFADDDRAVIGVILGKSTDDGVEVLGVSPDGPAERAGIEQGDVIVALMDEKLAGGEEDARVVLGEVMEGVKVGDELVIVVRRNGEDHEFTVTAEKREPFTWHSYARLPSPPDGSDRHVIVETIEIPGIDREALDQKLELMRKELDRTRIALDGKHIMRFSGDGERFEYDVEEFSELGDAVLAGTDMWFGMPMTRGLKLTEMEAGLGAYFNTDRGVLVLRAREDNELQLLSGDVILSVNGTEVNRPADVMRALRDLETGDQIDLVVMREKSRETLTVEVPEDRWGWELDGAPALGFDFEFHSRAPGGRNFVHPDHGD